MFEEANAAVEKDLAQGSLDSPRSESPSAESKSQEIADIDQLEKVKFQGKEWTREELNRAFMMQKDYTQKTQSLSEERKFSENLVYDLKSVMGDPSLAEEFKRIYPAKYHAYLDFVPKQASQETKEPSNVDPAFMQRFQTVEQELAEYKQAKQQAEVAQYESQIEATSQKMGKKYPLADEETVLARADQALKHGVELTEANWEKLWKAVSDRNQERYKKHYSEQIKNQQSASFQGRDIAGGGGVPGSSPSKMKLTDVKNHIINEWGAKN